MIAPAFFAGRQILRVCGSGLNDAPEGPARLSQWPGLPGLRAPQSGCRLGETPVFWVACPQGPDRASPAP